MNNIINFKDVNSDKYMKALVELLNEYTDAYNKGEPKVSDQEWDQLYFELVCCEKELGYAVSNSPTQIIHYNTVDMLKKVEHNHKMLSLQKTKDISEIIKFVNDEEVIAMCKMDGLTCSLRYINGRLVGAETRGDGFIGEDILHNALVIPSIPNNIPYYDELVIDGEIICEIDTFHGYFADDYAHIRNFAAGSIRLLSSEECYQRKLKFVAWDIIKGLDNVIHLNTKLDYLSNYGFSIVPYTILSFTRGEDYFKAHIDALSEHAKNNQYPIDGIVFKFNHVEYGHSLGETAHHFKNAMAYKFYDDEYETELLDIEWGMGRTGVLTPVAIFKSVNIDGTDVSRASLHNISVMEETLGEIPHKFQKIKVYKSNMIIPQISWADKTTHGVLYYNDYPILTEPDACPILKVPDVCPICGEPTQVITNDDVKILICPNSQCEGKLINRLDHFCGKKGLDIKGLSKATLEKLIDWEWVSNFEDIMTLKNHRSEWIKKPGFGPKSVDRVLEAIEESKRTTLEAFISALGIPLIGRTVSKELVKHIDTYEEFRNKAKHHFDFSKYDGFAGSKTLAIWNYDFNEADKVVPYLDFQEIEKTENTNTCANMKIVITGKLVVSKNRNELKARIEAAGGKVVDSVSSQTTYVICNDSNSTSNKIKSAEKFHIPVLTEQEFIQSYLIF